MYPRISDLLNDVFGIDIPLPFSSFGFMLALSFLVGCYFFALELWRKEKEGLIKPVVVKKNVIKENLHAVKYFKNIFIGFIIGYKMMEIILDYQNFTHDALSFILSLRGNWWGGLIGIFIGVVLKMNPLKRNKDQSENGHEIIIHQYQQIGKMALMATIFCFIGARLFHYFENIDGLINDPISALTKGGLNIYGGLVFGGAYIIFFIKKNKLDLLHFGDACAPALILAYGIARLGCQLSGDGDWGIPNDAPMPNWMTFMPEWIWAYNYPNNVLEVDLQSYFTEMSYLSITGKAWPTPLYEFIICLLFFLILWKLRKNIITPGVLFSIYLVLNGFERFTIELIRTNPVYQLLGFSATMAQWIALLLILLGIFGVFYFSLKRKIKISQLHNIKNIHLIKEDQG